MDRVPEAVRPAVEATGATVAEALRRSRHALDEGANAFKRLRTSLTSWAPGGAAAAAPPAAEEPPPETEPDAPVEPTDPYRTFGNKSVAVWDAEAATAAVIRVRGKHFRTMGCFAGGRVTLFAEEALYLAEREALVLLPEHPGEPEEGAPPPPMPAAATPREAYDLCLARDFGGDGRCPLPCYWAYTQLRGLGYVVCRPAQHDRGDGAAAAAPRAWDGTTDGAPEVPLAFECHQPRTNFAKSRLGDPAFRVFVCATTGGSLPSVTQLDALLKASGDVPVKAAVAAGDGTVLLFDLTAGVPDLREAAERAEEEEIERD